MRQTLFHITNEIPGLPGVPVFGFGLLLGIWLLGSVLLLLYLGRKYGFNADTLGNVPILAVVGVMIGWLLPKIMEPEGFPIRSYGVMMLVAVASATGLAVWRAKRRGLDPEMILSLAFWMILPGFFGARLFYVIQYWSDRFSPSYAAGGLRGLAVEVVRLDEGGLVVYGALLAAVPGLLLFTRKYHIPRLALCDLIVPSMFLGLALGRIGCLLNGCCFGGVCGDDHALGVTFPADPPPVSPAYYDQVRRGQRHGFLLTGDRDAAARLLWVESDSEAFAAGWRKGDRVRAINDHTIRSAGEAHALLWKTFRDRKPLMIEVENRTTLLISPGPHPERSLPVHPTQVYSSINALLLCLLLLAYDPLRRRDGELCALALSIYPAARFLLEFIRTDEPNILGTGMSIAQNVSLIMLLCAAGLWHYVLRRPRGTAFDGSDAGVREGA